MFYQFFFLFSFPPFRNSISSPSGGTALSTSAQLGHLEVCKLLVSSKCDVNSSNREYAHTPNLFLKCFTQKIVLFSFPTFRNSISSPSGWTALMNSAAGGRLEVCKLLVSLKADLAARHRCGRCQRCSRFLLNQSHPLACSSGKTALKHAMDRNQSDVVAFLRGIGAPQ
jgi:ankyrin repeat protein